MATDPVPAPCQAIADELHTLEQQYADQATAVEALTAGPAWTALAALGALRRQIQTKQAELGQCVATHTAALTGTVVLMDAAGGAPAPAQSVTLWDVAASQPQAVAPVQAGTFGFQAPIPAQAALTVQTAGEPELNGLDFRSGALPDVAQGKTPRVEMVLGPVVQIPASALTEALAAFEALNIQTPPNTGLNVTGTTLSLTFGRLTAELAPGLVTVSGNGTLSGGPLPTAAPFSASVTVALVASSAPRADKIVECALAGSPPVDASLAVGGLQMAPLVPFITGMISAPVTQALDDWANQAVRAEVIASFALPALPDGVSISLRRLSVDASGLSLQAALGTIGTGLSELKPAPLPVPV